MRTTQIIAGLALLGVIACSKPSASDKANRLEELKKQQAELSNEIKALEEELMAKGEIPASGKLVVATTMEAAPFQTYLEVQGRVDARENIDVSAEGMGVVRKINVTVGQQVAKGAVLAELDNELYTKPLDELKTQLEFAKTVFAKQKSLWDEGIGTELQYLQAKNQKESLEKRLASLLTQLDKTRIVAPVSGTVDEVMVKLGQQIAPGMPTFRVVNYNDMRVVADLAESNIAKVKLGDAVKLYFKDYDREETAKLSHVAKSINLINRTFRVEANLNTSGKTYNPNMVVVMRINDFSVDSALTVPINVIQRSEQGSFLMVAEKQGKQMLSRKRYVTVGRTYASQAQITDGLKAGDQVITVGYNDLNDGQEIRF
ncbi:MAG: efflux RND transporter periplasmic adaptor subunit [Sphingobacteriaceae bacterium]|nr:efflux RND transporter periplasmic adaptor subunit [Sphingobacteriaceae bacterium]